MFFDDNIGFLSLMMNEPSKPDVLDSKDGFILGNMFSKEYKPYKKYKPMPLKANTEKDAYLLKIMELNFAINDLNLYLDLHSDDKEMYNVFKKYVLELKELESEYVKKYEPLELTETTKDNYDWVNNWPWRNEDGAYV